MQNNKQISPENILHITSGEITANQLKKQLPQDDILPFNEAMCEGETCAEIFSDAFYRLRAAAYEVPLQEYLQKSPGNFLQSCLKNWRKSHENTRP